MYISYMVYIYTIYHHIEYHHPAEHKKRHFFNKIKSWLNFGCQHVFGSVVGVVGVRLFFMHISIIARDARHSFMDLHNLFIRIDSPRRC